MAVNLLFFGPIADEIGQRSVNIDPPSGCTSLSLVEDVRREYPGLDRHKLLFSLNQQFASGDEIVRDGDELAIFTPVSGG